jgi:hypothetical protein
MRFYFRRTDRFLADIGEFLFQTTWPFHFERRDNVARPQAKRTASCLERLQFDAALERGYRVDGNLPGLSMNLQAEAILEDGLDHGAVHDVLRRRAFGFCMDLVRIGLFQGAGPS